MIAIFAGSRQLDGYSQARQRAPQLMRNIQQQAAFGGQQCLDTVRHLVIARRELAKFVLAVDGGARGQVALPESFQYASQSSDRRSEVISEAVAQQRHQADDPQVHRLEEKEGEVS